MLYTDAPEALNDTESAYEYMPICSSVCSQKERYEHRRDTSLLHMYTNPHKADVTLRDNNTVSFSSCLVKIDIFAPLHSFYN